MNAFPTRRRQIPTILFDLRRSLPTPARYAIALLAPAVVVSLRLMAGFAEGDPPMAILFVLPILISAMLGGAGPGMVATLESALCISYFLMPPLHSFAIGRPINQVHVAVLLGVGVAVTLLVSALHRGGRDARDRKRRHAELLAARARLKALAEQSMVGIYSFDRKRFLYANPGLALMFGYGSPAELISRKTPMDLVHPDDRPATMERITEHLEGRQRYLHHAFRGIRKDGRIVHLEMHGSLYDMGAEPAVMGILLDVTERDALLDQLEKERSQLEEVVHERTRALNEALTAARTSEERYRSIFTQSSVPMLLMDPATGAIVEANTAACAYYGYSPADMGRLQISQINTLSAEEVRKEMDRAAQEQRNHFFFQHRMADGEVREVEVHSGPVDLGGRRLLLSFIHDITDRRQAEQQLQALNRDFVTLLDNTSDFIYFKDRNANFRFCSAPLARITGYSDWREMLGKNDFDVFPTEMARIYHEEEIPIFRDGRPLLGRIDPYFDEHGEARWVSTSKWPVIGADGRVSGIFGISRDITDQKRAEEELETAASVFRHASQGILVTDAQSNIIEVNSAFTEITGYDRDDVRGKNPRFLQSGHHTKEFYNAMWKAISEQGSWSGEIWNRRKDGGLFASHISISAMKDRDGKVIRYVGLFSDVTEFLRHHEEVEQMAYYDALTRLPNRVLLLERLRQAIRHADRNHNFVAVCFLDLDEFKPINDLYGHMAGDLFLAEMADRLRMCVRAEDTIARIGGDEFVLLLNVDDHEEWRHILERALKSIKQPSELPSARGASVSVSIGVTIYPIDFSEPDALIHHADQAMYSAKQHGRDRISLYPPVASADLQSPGEGP